MLLFVSSPLENPSARWTQDRRVAIETPLKEWPGVFTLLMSMQWIVYPSCSHAMTWFSKTCGFEQCAAGSIYLCRLIYGIYPPIRQLSLYNGWLIWSDLQGLLPSFHGGCSARLTLWHGCSNRNGTNWWLRRLLDPKIALALCLSLVVRVPLPCPSRVFPLIPSSSPTFS